MIIVDMQKDFLLETGPVYSPRYKIVLRNVRKILEVFRQRKLPIIHIITVHRKDLSDVELLEAGGPLSKSARYAPHGIEGTAGAEIIEELTPDHDEAVVIKKRFSAFYNTDLDMILRRKGVDTIFATGVTSDCCVRFTCADAYFRDYNVIMIRDCVDSDDEMDHKYALRNVEKLLGTTKSLDEVVHLLNDHAAF